MRYALISTAILAFGSCWTLAAQAAESASWPTHRGPVTTGSAPAQGLKLVDDLAQARLVWTSDQQVPGSYPRDRHIQYWTGGYCVPIVAEGRVYVHYWSVPGRTTYEMTAEDLEYKTKWNRNPFLPEKALDDVVHCFDMRTGKTLWRTVMPGTGWLDVGGGRAQMQCCYHDGRVFSPGSGLTMYAHDAATGELLWQAPLADGEKADRFRAGKGNNRYGSVAAVDGVVVCPEPSGNSTGPLRAFDAATGKLLWRVEETGAAHTSPESPLAWRHDGKAYFYKSGCLVEARSGRLCWSIREQEGLSKCKGGPSAAIAGDLLVLKSLHRQGQKDPIAGPVCYRISPQGFKRVWGFEEKVGHRNAGLVVGKRVCYYQNQDKHTGRYVIRDLETGELLVATDFAKRGETPLAYHPIGFEDRIFVLQNTRLHYFDIGGTTWRRLGEPNALPHRLATCVSGAYVDGLLFVRTHMPTGKTIPAADHGEFSRVVCYDLRAR